MTHLFPKVSILMAVYNSERFLEKSILCILEETYPNFELLIWNDGSTDNSQLIIEQFSKQDQRIKTFKSATNSGRFSKVLTNLTPHITGDYICVSDSDDYVHPQRLQTLIESAQKNPKAVLLHGRVDSISDASGETLYSYVQAFKTFQYFRGNYIPNGGAIFKTEAFHKVGGIDLKIHWAEDYEFRLRLSLEGPFVYTDTPFPLYYYVQHSSSYTSSQKNIDLELQFKEKFIEKYCDHPFSDVPKNKSYTIKLQFLYQLVFHTISLFNNLPLSKNPLKNIIFPWQLKKYFIQLGIKQGDTIFISSGFSAYGTIIGGARILIHTLQKMVGPTGRIIMPISDTHNFEDFGLLSKEFSKSRDTYTVQTTLFAYNIWGKDAESIAKKNNPLSLLTDAKSKIILCGKDNIHYFLPPEMLPFNLQVAHDKETWNTHIFILRNLLGLLKMSLLNSLSTYVGHMHCYSINAAQWQNLISQTLAQHTDSFLCSNKNCNVCKLY